MIGEVGVVRPPRRHRRDHRLADGPRPRGPRLLRPRRRRAGRGALVRGRPRRLPRLRVRRRARGHGRRGPGARAPCARRSPPSARPARAIKLIYTIPSLPQPRRRHAGSGAARRDPRDRAVARASLILEDDPYGLLGFDGEPPRAIRADDAEGVIYLGSFSKTIASGLRVGWAVAPHGVREKLVLANESAVLCPSNYSQLTVSEYLATQPWREQIKTFREVYRERRDALLESLQALMPEGTTLDHPGRRLLLVADAARTASTPRRCCRAPSPTSSPTCPAPASTSTARAGRTCGCPTATPSPTASARACAGWRPSSRPSSSSRRRSAPRTHSLRVDRAPSVPAPDLQ